MTRTPQLTYLQAGTAVTDFGIAVNEKYKDRETVMFIDVTFFGKAAEIVCQYGEKGRSVCVVGKLVLDKWVDQSSGQNRSKHKIFGDKFQLLGGRSGGDYDPAPQSHPPESPQEFPSDNEVPF